MVVELSERSAGHGRDVSQSFVVVTVRSPLRPSKSSSEMRPLTPDGRSCLVFSRSAAQRVGRDGAIGHYRLTDERARRFPVAKVAAIPITSASAAHFNSHGKSVRQIAYTAGKPTSIASSVLPMIISPRPACPNRIFVCLMQLLGSQAGSDTGPKIAKAKACSERPLC